MSATTAIIQTFIEAYSASSSKLLKNTYPLIIGGAALYYRLVIQKKFINSSLTLKDVDIRVYTLGGIEPVLEAITLYDDYYRSKTKQSSITPIGYYTLGSSSLEYSSMNDALDSLSSERVITGRDVSGDNVVDYSWLLMSANNDQLEDRDLLPVSKLVRDRILRSTDGVASLELINVQLCYMIYVELSSKPKLLLFRYLNVYLALEGYNDNIPMDVFRAVTQINTLSFGSNTDYRQNIIRSLCNQYPAPFKAMKDYIRNYEKKVITASEGRSYDDLLLAGMRADDQEYNDLVVTPLSRGLNPFNNNHKLRILL